MTEGDIQYDKECKISKLIEEADEHISNRYEHLFEEHYDSHKLVEDRYNKALEIDADNKMVLAKKSDFLVSKGRYDEANFCLNRIHSKYPKDHETHFRKGMLFAELGLYTEAVKWINEGIQIREEEQIELNSKKYKEWKEWRNAEMEWNNKLAEEYELERKKDHNDVEKETIESPGELFKNENEEQLNG